MLQNIFLKTLRDSWGGVLGWGVGLALVLLASVSQYTAIVGVGAQRTQNVAEMTKLLQSFSFLTGEVTSLGTVGGFITTRLLGFMPLMVSLWAVVLGVGMIRGEEQQGSLDLLLSTPKSRNSVLEQKVGALWLVLGVAIALQGLALLLAVVSIKESLPDGGLLLTVLNMIALVGFWGSMGVLAGQLISPRRKASSIVGGIMAAMYLLNNVAEGTPSLNGLAWLMPFHYYSLSKPLVSGRGFEVGAWVALVALSGVALALAGLLFARRDLGRAFSLGRARGAISEKGNPALLGSIFGKSLRDSLGASIGWGVGIGLYGALIIFTTKEALQPIRDLVRNAGGWIAALVGNMASNEAYLSITVFLYLPVLLTVFAIMQIESWASDEEEGRLEMLVAMPVPRWQVLIGRYAAIGIGMAIILTVAGAFLLFSAAIAGVSLDGGRVLVALAALLPTGLVVAAFGLCIAAWMRRPSRALYISIALVALMFLLETLAPIFNLPDAVRNLSIFHLYGRPLIDGVSWGGLLALVVACLLFGVGSLVGVARRDIAK